MTNSASWKRLKRKTAYDSKFLKVYEDEVRLPNGSVIEDYTVVEKPSIVMVVATDERGRVLVLNEYKYAADEVLRTLPAGHVRSGESSEDAAQRELLEETGYTGEHFEEVGILRDYPTKDLHIVHVVRVKKAHWKRKSEPEPTENISYELVEPNELKRHVRSGGWKLSSAIAALAVSGLT